MTFSGPWSHTFPSVVTASALVALLSYQVATYVRSYWFWPSIKQDQDHRPDAIVVTGADTGIGKHAALTLAQHGFTVFCGVLKRENGDALLRLAAELEIDVSRIKPICLDVTQPVQIEAAVQEVTDYVGKDRGLYGLFNNAGIVNPIRPGEGRSVEHLPMEMVRAVFEVNVFGLLNVTQAFLPLIRQRRGRILSNTSVCGRMATPYLGLYASSKFAVEALMDSLRRELMGVGGVQVSILEPGCIATPIYSNTMKELVNFQGVGVYAQDEVIMARQLGKLALLTCSDPRTTTSRAVVHAMRSPTPKTRYLVGGLTELFPFLALLPDAWVDTLLRLATRTGSVLEIADEELERLAEQSTEEYTL